MVELWAYVCNVYVCGGGGDVEFGLVKKVGISEKAQVKIVGIS